VQKDLQSLMRRWGNALTLIREGETQQIRGFLHPSYSKSLQNLYPQSTPLGQRSDGWYVYIGPAVPEVKEGDVLAMESTQYRLYRVETVLFRQEPLYCWGLCVKKGGEDTWGA